MNKLKKIGLSALAGSLAFTAVQAGELAVSGGAEVTYTHLDGSETTGTPWGMGRLITFSGSGDLDNGMTMGFFSSMNDSMSGISSSAMSIGMGTMGTVAYETGANGSGINSVDNMVPTAYEEADHGMDTGAVQVGDSHGSSGVLSYNNTFAGVKVSGQYNSRAGTGAINDSGTGGDTGLGSAYSMVFSSSDLVDGLTVGYGMGQLDVTANGTSQDSDTMWANWAAGAITVGVQAGNVKETGQTENNTLMAGISFAVNDNLAVSYQVMEDEYNKVGATNVTTEFTGISASYTMGSLSLKGAKNQGNDVGGTLGASDDNTELSLSVAF
jgi:outer membrane protein OmpU|tara:strand:+ start:18781 stop:19758 length:978 start_codon:yes stop_codon:yes gene_type:complete